MEQGVELKRLVCFVIVLALVSPGMYTLIKTENVAGDLIQDEHGNLVINGTSVFEINRLTIDPYTGMAGKYGMKGNITVKDGGTLIIRDAELYFIQDVYHHYWLSVSDNGRIIMENGSITVSTQQILPYVLFNISITNAGDCYINDSKIAFPGYFNVTGTNLTLLNSTFTNIEPPAGILPDVADMCDDAPVFHVSNSRIVFVNSSIEKCYENAYANATYVLMPLYRAGDDNTSNTNTAPLNSTDGNYYYVNSTQLMHVYGFDTQGNTGNILNAWLSVTYQTDLDYTSSTVLQISFDGGATWQDTTIAPNNQTTSLTETYTIGQTTFGNISNLHVRYLNGNDTLNVRFDQIVIYAQVYIGVNERDQYDVIFDDTTFVSIDSYIDVDFLSSQNPENPKDNSNPNHNRIVLRNNARAYLVNLTVNEMQSGGAHEDTPFITDASSEIYLYRWLDVSVLDAVNLPVQNARVSIAYNGVSGPIQQRVEMLNNITNPTNPLGSVVLAYLNKGVSNYNLTDASGKCSVPLVSDNISAAFWPNSMPYGNYRVSVTYNTTTLVKNVSFPVFPAINATSNRVTLNFSLAAVIEHPDIAISFSTEPEKIILANSQLELKVNITNTGSANATHFRVVFFEGFPQAGGTVFSAVDVPSLNAGVSIEITQNWSKAIAGKYKIVIVADYYNEIYEQNENNNTLSCDVIVYREGADMLIDGTPTHPNRTLKDINPYIHSGFIIVKGNGNLTLDNTSLNISQTSDYQYQIIVTENGSLFLQNNATISMDRGIVLSVADNGSLITRNGNLYNLSLLTSGNSNIDMKNTVVQDCMVAWDGAMIHLENTTIVAKEQPGSVYFADDFEGDLSGWTNYTIPARNGSWEAGTPYYISPHSGNVSFGTELLNKDRNGRYENDTQYVLISPQISLLAAPTALLTFYNYYRIQDDTAYVEVSTDMENWYAIASYTGTVSTWTKETIDITQYTGNMIYLRFRLSTNAALNDIGWYIDDVSVVQRFDIHARDIFMKDTAINTNLSELSATDRCTLVNATLPEAPNAVMARDSAEARIYRYLVVNVNDTNSQPVSGVNVNAYGYSNGTLCASGTTGGDGRTTLILLSDIINATTYQSSYFVGSYRIEITLGSEVITRNISFMAYPYWKNVVMLNVTLSTPMPDLAVGITNPPAFVTTNSSVQITVRVNNTGNAMAANAEIALYDVYAGTQSLVGKQNITLAGGAGSDIQFTWQPGASGIHNLLVIADPQNNITESNESNNEYVCEVIVYRPGVDLIVNGTMDITLQNVNYMQSGFVLIDDNGILRLKNMTLNMVLGADYQYAIMMRKHGTLIIDNATITGNYRFNFSMSDNTTLIANGFVVRNSDLAWNANTISITNYNFTNVMLSVYANSIWLERGSINAIYAENLHGTDVHIGNTTLNFKMRYYGSESAVFYNVTLPYATDAVLAYNNASVTIYRILVVRAYDGNELPLNNVVVNVSDKDNNQMESKTTQNGIAVFILLTDLVNASTPYSSVFVGNYYVDISYSPAGYSLSDYVQMPGYPDPEQVKDYVVNISTALPDVIVDFGATPPAVVTQGTVVEFNISVTNTGNAPTPGFNITLFEGSIAVANIKDVVSIANLGINAQQNVRLRWTASVPGINTLYVLADYEGVMLEQNKSNNTVTCEVLVYRSGIDMLIINTTLTLRNTYYIASGFVYIDNGTLILENTTFKLTQTQDFAFGIYLYGTGRILMLNSTITSDYLYYVKMYDTSQIHAQQSKFEKSVLSGNGSVFNLSATTYNGAIENLVCNAITLNDVEFTTTSLVLHGTIFAENTTFDRALAFNGTDSVTLVAVTLPSTSDAVLASDSAVVRIYRYLDIVLTDINGAGIDGAHVYVYDLPGFPGTWAVEGITANGTARIVLLSDIINSSTPYYSHFVGVYIVHIAFAGADFWYNITLPNYYAWDKSVNITEQILLGIPDLAVAFTTSLPGLVPTGTVVYGNITVWNNGSARAENVLVEIYDSITTVYSGYITLLANDNIQIPFSYTVNVPGYHTLLAVADPAGTLIETTKDNNNATASFIAFNPGSLLQIENQTVTISNTTSYQYGSVLIGYNGTLILDNATLVLSQPTVYNYGIYLYSNGTLIMKNSTITSGYQYYMVSTDNSQIDATNSIINLARITGTKNVSYTLVSTVIANASIDITASKFVMIGGSLTAGSWQYVSVTASEFYAQDIYYPSQLVFSGNARAILVNVTLSGSATDIQTNDEAQAYIYRYLDVLTLDGNKKPLETVNISMYFASNSTLAGWVITDIYGKARFVLLTDIINYTIQYIGGTSFFVGNYRLIANYSDELVYENISFESYPSMRNIVSVNITYLAQVPDFDVRTGDIRVPGTFDYIDGGNISITVRNIGPRNGVNITVVVYDMNLDDNTETEIYTTVLTLLSGEVKTFNYTWLPSIAGNHSIKVIIDPNNEFNETSKANNIAISQAVWFRPALEIIGISVSNTTLADDEMVYFNITIKNTGNVVMHNFNVILEDRALPQTYQEFIAMLNINSTANITFSYLVVKPGTHDVNIRIELDRVYATQSLTLNVYAPPDLSVSAADIRVTFGGSDVYKVLEQTPLNITINVSNIASTPAYNVSVEVYNGSVLINTTTIPEIAPLSSSEITLTWVASAPGMLTVSVLQCLQPYPEKYLDNNIAQKAVEVIEFPDLAVLDFYLEKEGNRTHNVTVGDSVSLSLNITNNATYTVDNITVEVFLGNISDENIVYASEISLNASEIVNLNFTWTVSAEGNITLNAVLNRNHTITEKNYTNNINTFNLTSLSARLVVILGSMASEFYIDDTPIVSGTVIREATGVGVPNINLTITIFKDDALYSQMNVTTDQNGNFSQALMKITEPGRYAIQISSTDISDIVPGTFTFNVPKPAAPQQFPWLMVIIAIIAVVGVSVGVVVLYFRRVAGKLVECGECGAYIPENATKCPKCGTEFEATTVKCSECGAWIDGKATVCPECGTVFTGKKVEAESYEEIMRKEFNAYVEKFRTEAKKELGKEYSESAFWAWWKNKPTYRTFSQWLKEEELKKKGALKCPQCTTLNEKTAKICHKCGSSLEGAELIQTEKVPGTKEVPVAPPPPKEEKAVEPKEVTQKAAEVKQPAPPQPTKTTVAPVQIPQQPAQPPAGQKPAPPQTPVPPKQVAPKEELPTLPGPLGVPPVPPPAQKPEEKAVLEFKPEEGAPGTPKVVVIKKPTAAKVVIPKKVVRKPMTPGTEQQAETPEEKKEQ